MRRLPELSKVRLEVARPLRKFVRTRPRLMQYRDGTVLSGKCTFGKTTAVSALSVHESAQWRGDVRRVIHRNVQTVRERELVDGIGVRNSGGRYATRRFAVPTICEK